MRSKLKHIIADRSARTFWNGVNRDMQRPAGLKVSDIFQYFICIEPEYMPHLLAGFIERFPQDLPLTLLKSFAVKIQQWMRDDDSGLNSARLWPEKKFFKILFDELSPIKRALFGARPKNEVEWQLLADSYTPELTQLLFDAVAYGDDAEFAMVTALPLFNPYAYLRGVHDYISQINASTDLTDAQRSHRVEQIQQLQKDSCDAVDRSCLNMHMSRQPFAIVDLAGFSNAIDSYDPVMVPEDYSVPDCNPEIIARFFTLTSWLEQQGFEAIRLKLQGNVAIRTANVFQQTVFRLELFCANIWSTLQKAEFVETVYCDVGVEIKALKCRENFINPEIIDQLGNCAEGVEEGFIALERFLNVPFHQKLFNDVKRNVLIQFHRQYGTRPGMEVHVDDAELSRSLGLYVPDAYKSDSYRLLISTTQLQSLSGKILLEYSSALIAVKMNVSIWLQQLKGKSDSGGLTQDCNSIVLLMRACEALSEIDIDMTPAQLLKVLTTLDEQSAIEWCEQATETIVANPKYTIIVTTESESYTQFNTLIGSKFKMLVSEIEQVSESKYLFDYHQGLVDILSSEDDITDDQNKILTDVLTAPDGLYFIMGVIERMNEGDIPVIAKKLLVRASNGESIYTALAKDAELAQLFVGAHVRIERAEYEIVASCDGASDLYDLLASIASATAAVSERADDDEMKDDGEGITTPVGYEEYHHQAEMLLTAPGAVNYWLGHLARDGRYNAPGELLVEILSYLVIKNIPPYRFNSFSELLTAFMQGSCNYRVLATSYLEERLRVQLQSGDYEAYLATAVLLPEKSLTVKLFDEITSTDLLISSSQALRNFVTLVGRSDVEIGKLAAEKIGTWVSVAGAAVTPLHRQVAAQLGPLTESPISAGLVYDLLQFIVMNFSNDPDKVNEVLAMTKKLKMLLSPSLCEKLYRDLSKKIQESESYDIDEFMIIVLLDLQCSDELQLKRMIEDFVGSNIEPTSFDQLVMRVISVGAMLGAESKQAVEIILKKSNPKRRPASYEDFRELLTIVFNTLGSASKRSVDILLEHFSEILTMPEISQMFCVIHGKLAKSDTKEVVESVLTSTLKGAIICKHSDLMQLLDSVTSTLGPESKVAIEIIIQSCNGVTIPNGVFLSGVIRDIYTTLKGESKDCIKALLDNESICENIFINDRRLPRTTLRHFEDVMRELSSLKTDAKEMVKSLLDTVTKAPFASRIDSYMQVVRITYQYFRDESAELISYFLANPRVLNCINAEGWMEQFLIFVNKIISRSLIRSEFFSAFLCKPGVKKIIKPLCADEEGPAYSILADIFSPEELESLWDDRSPSPARLCGLFAESDDEGDDVDEAVAGDIEEKPDAQLGQGLT
ncbi:MAG: hypothetical protein P1U63_05890 [Coxiellaceae bacterium]|nr:hypothetical protein [Coxiellaceae bacterium]